jgi:peptide/nickel transport system permease protein
MSWYIVRRLVFSVILVGLVSSSALVLTGLAPGDITSEQVGTGVSRASMAAERQRLGLDRPIFEQWATWVGRAARLDFGTSLLYGRPVWGLVAERARNTAVLAGITLLVATAIGLPLGVVAGSRKGWLSFLIRALSTLLLSLPSLVSSLVLVYVAAHTGWLPTGGMSSMDAAATATWSRAAADLVRHLVVPVAALALPLTATIERIQANATAEVLGEPYVAATRARGVPWDRLLWRDALKPALRPVASVYGMVCGSLLSGSFVVEMVTAWPGLGRLMYDALRSRDLYLVAGCAAAGGLFLAVGALASDIALAAIDPRLRGRVEEGT